MSPASTGLVKGVLALSGRRAAQLGIVAGDLVEWLGEFGGWWMGRRNFPILAALTKQECICGTATKPGASFTGAQVKRFEE